MERHKRPGPGGSSTYRPEGIEARMAHAQRHLEKRRRARAEAAFHRGLTETR
ncbi:MAG TPA: hypothetical protein PKL28_02075 [Rhodocyclaceae bacterium]|jgi:hypothetical protein|nr:hypothetical protein [Rhodocyclaceae bacterium]HMW77899.1 hypothetical protein [Rhodocyclaceae bacterium]HNE42391.1 hypothetical protein [Rhodocyclaceae bacterium]HNL21666.1 hypothetical protein [Rhodocyclaceae bacterium]HNM23384.1 hypothetical protein [Rhodocyclaceae bacterium]